MANSLKDLQSIQMMKAYAQAYPSLVPYLSSSSDLMRFIDITAGDKYLGPPARSALREIYGITDYTPRGTLQWSNEAKQWINPRIVGNGDTEQSPYPPPLTWPR